MPDSEDPFVDILIITYNQQQSIAKTIQSCLNQTYEKIRIIIADDCSTDGTQEMIERLYRQYPDKILPIYNEKNLGITGNSNVALSQSTSEYFMIMGGDDLLYPERISKQIDWFREHPDMSLCGSAIDVINFAYTKFDHFRYNRRQGTGNVNWIRYGMLFGTISIMYKKHRGEVLYYDERLYYVSDIKFCIDFLSDDKKYGFLDSTLSAYRKTEASITISNLSGCLNDCTLMFQYLKVTSDPSKASALKKGYNYLVTYAKGIINLYNGNYKKAVEYFIRSFINDPTLYKAPVRFLQTVSLWVLKKFGFKKKVFSFLR